MVSAVSENIFLEQSEFITLDPRSQRREREGSGYRVTPEFMYIRHEIIMPPELVKGNKILDLGSCLAATGAWSLAHGATFYQGVEIHEEFVNNSKTCLEKYYPQGNWSIAQQSIEEFLESSTEHFDILVASGILYGTEDPVKLLSFFARVADFLVIESVQNQTILHSPCLTKETKQILLKDSGLKKYLENDSYIAVGEQSMVIPVGKSIRYLGFNPSMGAVRYILRTQGFECDTKPNDELGIKLTAQYNSGRRFALHFKRMPNSGVWKFGVRNAIEDPVNIIEEVNW